jgi:hypothetical protein
MNFKKFRHFVFGLLLGTGAVYGYTFYFDSTIQLALDWLQQEADAYRAENPTPTVNTGWGKPKGQK